VRHSFGGEQEERQRLLQVEADDAIGVAGITDRDVLADVQVEIAARVVSTKAPAIAAPR